MILTTAEIITAAAQVSHIPEDEIVGPRRLRYVMRARMAVYILAREQSRRSYPMIGRRVGGRDHSTVLTGRRRGLEILATDPDFAQLVADIRTRAIRNKLAAIPRELTEGLAA